MDLPWYTSILPKYQTRYSPVKKIKSYQLLGKTIDRVVMYFIDKDTDKE